jgi:sulfatase modifying factor 1
MDAERAGCMVLGAVAILSVAGGARAVDVETLPVGNPGNADDTRGYGGVDYEYRIGKYEVTAGEYCEFLNAVAATDTYGLYSMDMSHGYNDYGCDIQRSGSAGTHTYSVAADWANRPVNYVSWGDAARFANWLHNGEPTGAEDLTTTEDGAYYLNGATTNAELLAVTRKADWRWAIPTEDEWYKAAYHKNDGNTAHYYVYPTGSDTTPSKDLVDPDPGNNATFYDGAWPDPAGYTIGRPYYRTEAGAHENSGSPYGTFDQGGNVYEWNEAISEGYRGNRGGSFYSGDLGMYASLRFWEYPASGFRYGVGFRVVHVPESATLSLLALGGLVVMRRRRRRRGTQ